MCAATGELRTWRKTPCSPLLRQVPVALRKVKQTLNEKGPKLAAGTAVVSLPRSREGRTSVTENGGTPCGDAGTKQVSNLAS